VGNRRVLKICLRGGECQGEVRGRVGGGEKVGRERERRTLRSAGFGLNHPQIGGGGEKGG